MAEINETPVVAPRSKWKSRKFWLAVAAFCGSLGTGIAGLAIDNEWVAAAGIVCSLLSAAIYAAAEAYVDGKSVESTQSRTTMTLTGHAAITEE